ncbi:DUF2304 domain-containing protein [Jeotgalibacillus proteolyticus]|uniref:DUF2304 domain-containing protein n=1 Tax=Jeotgalibacillus proteolyticus TaxID=2082395 RepID=A0A2S5GB75_9BACL|nr:DUF2304 domain-containing protein [Jeotgalibacillus proteolyticus]PPA70272.1 DUF2304 domain-containing protein [Jeotgalibacillus proteolyticus]
MSITLVSFFIIFFFFLIVIESVRRGILETKYSILWIIVCIVLGVMSLATDFLEQMAYLLGVVYAPSLLFLFGLIASLILIFDLTRRISNLNSRLIALTQEYALFREESNKEMTKQEKENEQ